MADSRVGAGKTQDELGLSCDAGKKGSAHKMMETYWTGIGAKLKALPMAKTKTMWSIKQQLWMTAQRIREIFMSSYR